MTRALLQEGHRAVGLCNVAIGFQRTLSHTSSASTTTAITLGHVGLNHLTWIRAVHGRRQRTCCPSSSAVHGDEFAAELELPRRLLDELGAIPSYYLRYFYEHDVVLAEQQTGVPRATTVAEIERELLDLYRDPQLTEKPPLLERRGGAFYSEAAIGLVASLHTGDGKIHEVDIRNNGTLAGLAPDDVVEVPAAVSKEGAGAAAAAAASTRAARPRPARGRL